MSSSHSPLIVPPTRLLVTGRQDATQGVYARRSSGTADWLLIYTEKGQAYFRFKGGEFKAGPDDAVLVRPGTPHDYGLDPGHGHWKNTWIHFLPRPGCLPWLQWPEIAPGLMHLHLTRPTASLARRELRFLATVTRQTGRGREELATNALERVLLFCDGLNPRHEENKSDVRIRKAVDILSSRYQEPFTLATLARACALSRSRLAELFLKEIGTTPMAFLETRRLRRTQELLQHTSFTLEEIAQQTGFSNAFYLSLRFKKHYDLNPRTYRQQSAPS